LKEEVEQRDIQEEYNKSFGARPRRNWEKSVKNRPLNKSSIKKEEK